MEAPSVKNRTDAEIAAGSSVGGLDPALEQEGKADALEVLGGLLGLFDVIPLTFVWSGFRVGSYMWLVWFLAQALAAVTLVEVAWSIRSKAAKAIERAVAQRVARPPERLAA